MNWFKPSCLIRGLAAALLLAAWSGAEGARITLKNGEVLEGRVIEESVSSITVQTLSHTLRIPMARVESITEGGPGSTEIYQAKEALAEGDLELGERLANAALKAGAPEEEVAPILEEIETIRDKRELARYQETINRAQLAFEERRESDALGILNSLLAELDEDSAARIEVIRILCDFHLDCAQGYRDRVQNESAVRELERVIDLDPTRSTAYVDLGDIYGMSTATWDLAIANYMKALKRGSGDLEDGEIARIHWRLAEIFRQRQDWRDASFHYRKAYQIDPGVNVQLAGRMLRSFQRYAEELKAEKPGMALAVVEEGLRVRRDPEMIYMKGLLLSRLDRHRDAIATLAQLSEEGVRRKGLYYQMAVNHFELGEILTGREMLQREIESYPDNYEALCLLGDYALQRDDFEAAQGFYRQARTFAPDKPRAWLGLGKAYRQRSLQLATEEEQAEGLQKAREAVEQVLARLRNDREANLEMGRILRDEKKLNEATEYFTKVLALIDEARPSEQEDLRELKADALLARGEIKLLTAGPGTANMDFRQALEALPDYAQAYFSIGRAYRKKFAASKNADDLKVAEKNLLKALELQPENPQFPLELGILYQQELAQVDEENEEEYLGKAVVYYNMYIELGGANAGQVRQWIREIQGG